ncbi:unnamed protein product [Laminaria digitata]
MVYEDNVVKKMKTAFENLKGALGLPDNLRKFLDMTRSFVPDVVISDFESWTYTFAKSRNAPIISIDNMQVIARCHHDDALIREDLKDFLVAKRIVRAKLSRCNRYLITSFFYPPTKRPRTSLHPPILRDVVLKAKDKVRTGEHVLVYQSGTSHDSLVDELKRVQVPFRVYGLKRDLSEPLQDDNVTHCPFSEAGFIEDLATAKAVIAGGGFTLMGEAVFLGKPMLSVPLVGQFEQALNANYLQALGYGQRAPAVTADGIESFLAQSQRYTDNLRAFEHDGNTGVFDTLEQAMQDAVKEGARGVD